eukprot:3613609-Prymnesium_polylepis.1
MASAARVSGISATAASCGREVGGRERWQHVPTLWCFVEVAESSLVTHDDAHETRATALCRLAGGDLIP